MVKKRVIVEVRRPLLFIEGPQPSVFEILKYITPDHFPFGHTNRITVSERFLGKNCRMDSSHHHFPAAFPVFIRDRVGSVRRVRHNGYSDKVCLFIEIDAVEGLLYDANIPIRRRQGSQ